MGFGPRLMALPALVNCLSCHWVRMECRNSILECFLGYFIFELRSIVRAIYFRSHTLEIGGVNTRYNVVNCERSEVWRDEELEGTSRVKLFYQNATPLHTRPKSLTVANPPPSHPLHFATSVPKIASYHSPPIPIPTLPGKKSGCPTPLTLSLQASPWL